MHGGKILVIEDEVKVANLMRKGLSENGFDVDIALDGQIGLRMANLNPYDAIIIDVNLPLLNGYSLCSRIRKIAEVPIIMVTAMGSTDDKLAGFENGADDYMVKPFEFRELVARVRALLKRARKGQPANIIKVADLEVNLDSKSVKRAGKKIDLTAKEYLLLEFLVRNKGKVVTRSDIAERIWDVTFDTGTNVIEVYINFLRKKIDRNFKQKLLHTQIGLGYILTEA